MNNKIKEIIVVEGKTDIDFLSSFLDADFYSVNGSAITDQDIEFLAQASKQRGIIVLTDPDFPGMQIRNKIKERIPEAKHAYVRKEVSIKHGKVGVAESTKDEVIHSLSNLISFEDVSGKITNSDLFDLGLNGQDNSSELRKKLCDYLKIGYSNSKQLLLKLNSINISLKEIKDILNVK